MKKILEKLENREISFQEAYKLVEDLKKDVSSEDAFKIYRTYSAGVFVAQMHKRFSEKHAILKNARRIWRWEGAASLSQLAIDGTSKPDLCKFPEAVDFIEVTEIIEILDMTDKAIASIQSVPVWKA